MTSSPEIFPGRSASFHTTPICRQVDTFEPSPEKRYANNASDQSPDKISTVNDRTLSLVPTNLLNNFEEECRSPRAAECSLRNNFVPQSNTGEDPIFSVDHLVCSEQNAITPNNTGQNNTVDQAPSLHINVSDDEDMSYCPSSSNATQSSVHTVANLVEDFFVPEQELHQLQFENSHSGTSATNNNFSQNAIDARQTVVEDIWSSTFCNGLDEVMERSLDSFRTSTNQGCENAASFEREAPNTIGGLENWNYSSPFVSMEMDIDEINTVLAKRFCKEANEVIKRVTSDIQQRQKEHEVYTETNLSRLAVLEVFLPNHVLSKITANVNRILLSQKKQATTVFEFKGVLIVHVLAASYSSTVKTITAERNKPFFFQVGISGNRYLEIWSALSLTIERRQRVEHCGDGWFNFPQRANAMITELEDELAAVNRYFLYVPGATVFSLDDDHQRLRSRAVAHLTAMSHVNNPQKALGPVNNALCSALNPVFLASHYSRPGEKVIDVWERLVRLLQGVPTAGPVRPMVDAIFASDRGYNGTSTIDYINDRIGATGLGTHKRSYDYPFVWGVGPIRKKHKGMVVSERGCRAIYSAKRKPATPSGRMVEAAVYRESFSGRIAAVYHNNPRLFSANKFTLVPKSGHRQAKNVFEREVFHIVYDKHMEEQMRRRQNTDEETVSLPRMLVSQTLLRVNEVTLLQSEDPGWFLSRAFRFTSRTSQSFLKAFTEDLEDKMETLASLVAGKHLNSTSTSTFPSSAEAAKQCLISRMVTLCHCLNMRTTHNPTPNERELAVAQFMTASESSLQPMTINAMLSMMSAIGQPLSRQLKAQLIAKIIETQQRVQEGTLTLSVPSNELSAEEQLERKKTELLKRLYRASLTSWVMKPLVSTAGMKEGSFNEAQVLKALPAFFETHRVTNGTYFTSHSSEHTELAYTVDFIRTIGLVESRNEKHVADSPDAILCFSDSKKERHVCAVEIKTMTALNTIEAARQKRDQYAPITVLNDVGLHEKSTELFQALVPSTEYRTQCLHHALTLELKWVMFVEAKGSNCGMVEVIYVTIVEFYSCLKNAYGYMLAATVAAAFDWIGKSAANIPEAYDALLQASHASDLHSYASFYSLSEAYKSLVRKKGTLPPAKMIRPTALVYWNYLKGGVDEFSRAMTDLCYTNTGENPIVSIIGRLLCAQVNNAAVVHRLSLAKRKGRLQSEYEKEMGKGYREIRKAVSQCTSFADYARQLAREYVELSKALPKSLAVVGGNRGEGCNDNINEDEAVVKPLYTRNIVDMYNRPEDRKRRLTRRRSHMKVRGKGVYCALCSYSHTITKNGKVLRKKGGSRQRQWCSVCQQAICSGCWDAWHKKNVLKKASIPEIELQKLLQKANTEGNCTQ